MSEDKFTEDDNKQEVSSNDEQTENVIAPQETTENKPEANEQTESSVKKLKPGFHKAVRIISIVAFFIFAALFINEVIIQPIRIKNSIDETRDLYEKLSPTPIVTKAPVKEEPTPVINATPTPDPNRDSEGRLLQFEDLLKECKDVKGWITIKDTNVDYVVAQGSVDKPDYYLDKDIDGDYSKAGTLYLDIRSSVEDNTQNLVIHGHNMVSTAEKMFHHLLKYKKVSYYQEHPVITFDTIYNTGEWKVFAVFITNGSDKKEELFDYRKSNFQDSSDFLNFVYQLRIRSVLNINDVDINEKDQLLTLSTCSYELDNYRTVIVARKVRAGEAATVDVNNVSVNEKALYPESYYKRFGGKAPELADTFEDALANGDIKWYNKAE